MTVPHDNLPTNEGVPNVDDEAEVRRFLAARLDTHLGAARGRFEEALADEEALGSANRDQRGIRRSVVALLAAAACAAFAVGLWLRADSETVGPQAAGAIAETSTTTLVGTSHESAGRFTPLEYNQRRRSRDLGTYVLDGKPVQAVHRQQWQTTQYTTDGYTVRIERPREELVFVDAPVQ